MHSLGKMEKDNQEGNRLTQNCSHGKMAFQTLYVCDCVNMRLYVLMCVVLLFYRVKWQFSHPSDHWSVKYDGVGRTDGASGVCSLHAIFTRPPHDLGTTR